MNGTGRKATLERGDQKPAALPVVVEGIPESLRYLRRWLIWSWVWKHGKWTKPPLNPRTFHLCDKTDPANWLTFDEALALHRTGKCDGIGFALGRVDETGRTLAGVDLDDCRDPDTGELEPWAAWVVARLGTYGEVSPPLTGAKLLCWGQLPRGRRVDHARGVEMYDGGAYFTVTGRRLPGTPGEVEERGEALRQLHAELLDVQQQRRGGGEQLGERDLALSALAGLSTKRAEGYGDWLGVGIALHSVADDLLNHWDQWSRVAKEKYQEGACAAKWRTFQRGRGIGLGSLLHWARQDGWTPPRKRPQGGRAAPAPSTNGDGTAPEAKRAPPPPAGSTGYDICLWYLRQEYAPVFRRGQVIYSGSLGREVKVTEACMAPGKQLVEVLLHAADVPRNQKGEAKRQDVPLFYSKWAKCAWVDLVKSLPDEDQAAEVSDAAREEFRRHVATALHQHISLGETTYDGRGRTTTVERRAVIDWCCRDAKPGPWRAIRSHRCWFRRVADPAGGERLEVALRVELFGQLGYRPLADLSQNRFTRLCANYDVGTSSKSDRPHGQAAVVMTQDFLAGLLINLNTPQEGEKAT